MNQLLLATAFALVLWQGAIPARGQQAEQTPTREVVEENANPQSADPRSNVESPTLGGVQLWADELVFHDWRIQRHFHTGHYRLLDDQNTRRAWGDFEHCRGRLDKLKRELSLPPMKPRVVIAVHGLLRSRGSMKKIGQHIEENSSLEMIYVSYPSTRADIDAHSSSLARVIENLEGVEEIHFVAHSLGNLVIRHFLAKAIDPQTGRLAQVRLGRFVMLAPPNHGAQMAVTFKNNKLLDWIWGKSAKQLAVDWDEMRQRLATPPCPFGIIAGGNGTETGLNPLVEGDDDFVLSVAETRLGGATDFIVMPVRHGSILAEPLVRERTLRFLLYGYFLSADSRRPIAVNEARHPSAP